MKIQHYAIIFLVIMIPFSIVCRNVINKKMINLREETKYNNFIDNATYDAVNVIHDMAGTEAGNSIIYGKNVPVSEGVCEEAIKRFYNTLSVDFNLPMGLEIAGGYLNRYIPAIIIVGYDGLYVYSCEETNSGTYEFKLKPKIPYSASYKIDSATTAIINYTLDNYVRIYFASTNDSATFGKGYYGDGSTISHEIKGYVGSIVDQNYDHENDFFQYTDNSDVLSELQFNSGGLRTYSFNSFGNGVKDWLFTLCANNEANTTKQSDLNKGALSYFLFEWARDTETDDSFKIARKLAFLFYDDLNNDILDFDSLPSVTLPSFPEMTSTDYTKFKKFNFANVNKDYSFDRDKHIIDGAGGNASAFHQMRRHVIIDTITRVMREEFNEHNEYAKLIGVTYNFSIPTISNDQWNNTIDDVSVLAFIQGMPLGGDVYYNNYSLGGARIVQAENLFCEIVNDSNSDYGGLTTHYHHVYHKKSCPCLPRDKYGDVLYCENADREKSETSIGYFGDPGKTFVNQRYEPAEKCDFGVYAGKYEYGYYPDGSSIYKTSRSYL